MSREASTVKKTSFNLKKGTNEVASVKEKESLAEPSTLNKSATMAKKKTSMMTSMLMPPKDDVKINGIRRQSKFTGMLHPEQNV